MDSMDQNRQDAVSIQDTEGKDPETTGVPQADHGTDTDRKQSLKQSCLPWEIPCRWKNWPLRWK